jgi:hypothetical protein
MRTNVTAEDQAVKNDALGSLSWELQEGAIRRGNSILLARTLAAIEAGAVDAETVGNLSKCSAIAKQWTVEKRQGGDADPSKLSIDQLRKAAGQ